MTRPISVQIRLSNDEWKQFREGAKARGYNPENLQDYIRSVILLDAQLAIENKGGR